MCRVEHFSDQNQMVPGGFTLDQAALKRRQNTGQQRNPGASRIPTHAFEAIRPIPRKPVGQILLLFAQNVNAEGAAILEVLNQMRPVVNTNQD